MFDYKSLNAFPPRSETKQGGPLLPFQIKHHTRSSSQSNEARESKSIQIGGKKRSKTSLFTDDIQ